MEIEETSTTLISTIQTGLLIMFVVLLIIFIYFGVTLVHHWNYYSFNAQIKKIMESLYFFISVILLLVLLILIGMYFLGYGF